MSGRWMGPPGGGVPGDRDRFEAWGGDFRDGRGSQDPATSELPAQHALAFKGIFPKFSRPGPPASGTRRQKPRFAVSRPPGR